MFKNVASKVAFFAFDTTTGLPKTGDAANLTAYVSKDYGSVTVLADTSATEMSSTNAAGWYLFDTAQAETNADALVFTCKSSTGDVAVVGQTVFTTPNLFSSLAIDAGGRASANATQFAGQTITAAAGVTLPSSVASPTNITAGVITTVTTLTNAPADSSGITALLGKFTGITVLAQWLGLLAGKQAANSTAQTEIRATGAGSGTYDPTTDSLEALKDDQMSATDIQDAVWDVAIAGHVDAGSTGEALDAASTGSSLTVQEIVDGVWDEPIADHLDSGTTGAALNGAGSAGDPWGTTLPGAYGAGTAGKIVGDALDAAVSSRASQTSVDDVPTVSEFNARTIVSADYATAAAVADVPTVSEFNARTVASADYANATDQAAIKAKTDPLPAAPASTTNITAGTITTVTNLTNAPANGDLTATMKASVTTAATAATPTVTAGTLGATAAATVRTQAGLALGTDYGAIPA